MTLDRVDCEATFRDAVTACTPARFVKSSLHGLPMAGRLVYGIALGNSAVSMVRGAGPVMHGVVVTHDDDPLNLPKGWSAIPDDETASFAIVDVIAAAGADDGILVLLSGGAEHVVSRSVGDVELAHGGLTRLAAAHLRTLIASNLEGDNLARIGGAPTFPPRAHDLLRLTIPRGMFWGGMHSAMGRRYGQVEALSVSREPATQLAVRMVERSQAVTYPHLWFGVAERPAKLPAVGRAQHLALAFAHQLRGLDRSAFVAATCGLDDGPVPDGAPRPAGAFVDGTTWAAIAAAGIDPVQALANGEAGAALRAVGALVITHFTGLDHGGDIVMIG